MLRCAKNPRFESSRVHVTSPLELLHLYTAAFNFSVRSSPQVKINKWSAC